MNIKVLIGIFFMLLGNLLFAQKNKEFLAAKSYFDKQRALLGSELHKKYNRSASATEREMIKKDFAEFMYKLDSVQNVFFINELIRVKNREDLEVFLPTQPDSINKNISSVTDDAHFPGGISALRQKLTANIFYACLDSDKKHYHSEITFMVDKEGYITRVKAEGESAGFNRQAEIAMYLIEEKFSPALYEGSPVRSSFRVPVTLNFE